MNQLAQASAVLWQEAAERTLQVSQLEAANGQLKGEVERHAHRIRALEGAQMECEKPTYEGLGARIISILALADKEARELRTRAQADAANDRALAEESALATRQDADDYAMQTQSANDDETARTLADATKQADSLLDDAKQRADGLLDDAKQRADGIVDDADHQAMARQDADRQAMAQREEPDTAYERARASSAAAAIDFETTLAARRDSSALEFAVQVTAAEQHLAAVRLRSERTRRDCECVQQEAETKCTQMLEQAMATSQALLAEAKTKAERIRGNSEREVAAATQRRDSINTQASILRRDLAALGGIARTAPVKLSEPAADESTDHELTHEEIDDPEACWSQAIGAKS